MMDAEHALNPRIFWYCLIQITASFSLIITVERISYSRGFSIDSKVCSEAIDLYK